jgi:hypothetical protein
MGCGETCPVVPRLRRMHWPLEDPKDKPIERVREIRDDVRRIEAVSASASVSSENRDLLGARRPEVLLEQGSAGVVERRARGAHRVVDVGARLGGR